MNSILHHSAIKQSQTEMMQYFLITDNNKHIIMFMWMHLSCSIMFICTEVFFAVRLFLSHGVLVYANWSEGVEADIFGSCDLNCQPLLAQALKSEWIRVLCGAKVSLNAVSANPNTPMNNNQNDRA